MIVVAGKADSGTVLQIRLMQAHMAPHRIRYNVRNISYTEDDRYIQSASFAHPGAIAMKSELGRGGYDSLNLYFYGGPFGNVGGYCKQRRESQVESQAIEY